jgi:hypothetical protein
MLELPMELCTSNVPAAVPVSTLHVDDKDQPQTSRTYLQCDSIKHTGATPLRLLVSHFKAATLDGALPRTAPHGPEGMQHGPASNNLLN